MVLDFGDHHQFLFQFSDPVWMRMFVCWFTTCEIWYSTLWCHNHELTLSVVSTWFCKSDQLPLAPVHRMDLIIQNILWSILSICCYNKKEVIQSENLCAWPTDDLQSRHLAIGTLLPNHCSWKQMDEWRFYDLLAALHRGVFTLGDAHHGKKTPR